MSYLSRGDVGPAVRTLQEKLNTVHKPFPPLVPDGKFGLATDGTVRSFQYRRGLDPDGVVGPKTQAALNAPAPSGPSVPQLYRIVQGVKHVKQDKKMSCWLACAQMLINWRRSKTGKTDMHPDPATMPEWSKLYADDTGILNHRIAQFAKDMGFVLIPPLSAHPKTISSWLSSYGPLWVNGVDHITVIAGIRGNVDDPDVLVFDPEDPFGAGGQWRNLFTWYVLNSYSGRDISEGTRATFLRLPTL